MKLKVLLSQSEAGYAECEPALPGCWSQGNTREEALENIADAVREYLGTEVDPSDGAEVQEVEVAVYMKIENQVWGPSLWMQSRPAWKPHDGARRPARRWRMRRDVRC